MSGRHNHSNTPISTTTKGAAHGGGSVKGRMTDPLREAIRIRVQEGVTITEACARAHISVSGWHAALKKPHVAQYIAQKKAEFIQEVDAEKAVYKRRAYEVAAEFLRSDATASDRKWAVEFFTRDDLPRRSDRAQVHINMASGYEFVRPGQRVVDLVEQRHDAASASQADKREQ